MLVNDQEWIRAFASATSSRYLSSRNMLPVSGNYSNEVFGQVHWVGRIRYELQGQPTQPVVEAVRILFSEFQNLRMSAPQEDKIGELRKMIQKIELMDGEPARIAASAMKAVIS